jgi:hypothetical protein
MSRSILESPRVPILAWLLAFALLALFPASVAPVHAPVQPNPAAFLAGPTN